MATTVNGWPVIEDSSTNGPLPRLRKWKVPGTERHYYLRDGSCGFVLMHFILWFHDVVEDIDKGIWDEWGWAVRPVRGQSTGFSNHAGGVAADINATQHPLGVRILATFSSKEIGQIRTRVKRLAYRGLIIWGGNWDRPDGMHVELAPASLAKVERVARRLMNTRRGKRILAANPGAKKVIES